MACSDCYPGNSTVILSGDNVQVEGSGTTGSPYIISAFGSDAGDRMTAVDVTANPDLFLANIQRPMLIRATLESDGNLTLPSDWGMSTAGTLVLVLTQGAGGSHDIDFAAAGVKWTGAINLSNTVGAVDVITLLWTGLDWIATRVLLNVV